MSVLSGEFAAVSLITTRLASGAPKLRPSNGETWIGDDAAVIGSGAGWTLLATDTVVEGVHADLSLTGLSDLGWKVVVANLSDIAAMGGRPGHAVVAVSGPPSVDLAALYDGIAEASDAFGLPVVGGDLTNAPVIVVTVALTGHVEGRAVLRSGARAGDTIWVTAPLGSSAAGLRSYRSRTDRPPVSEMVLRRAHARPFPALAEGLAAAAAGATAMTDVSDGLAADLGHIAEASGVGIRLDEVPVAAGATEADALGGGEDYELVFCAPDDTAVIKAFSKLATPLRIGICTTDPAERTLRGDVLVTQGWQHGWQAD